MIFEEYPVNNSYINTSLVVPFEEFPADLLLKKKGDMYENNDMSSTYPAGARIRSVEKGKHAVKVENPMVEEEIPVKPRKTKSQKRFWKPEEDRLLLKGVQKYGENNWRKVSENIPSRDATQCSQRWKKVMKPGLKKGHWSKHEDAMLRDSIQSQLNRGAKRINWILASETLQNRSCKQCRERWVNHLDPTINKSDWTLDEDKLLLYLHAMTPKKWATIARQIPGRTENMVKVRYNILTRDKSKQEQEEREYAAMRGGTSLAGMKRPRPEDITGGGGEEILSKPPSKKGGNDKQQQPHHSIDSLAAAAMATTTPTNTNNNNGYYELDSLNFENHYPNASNVSNLELFSALTSLEQQQNEHHNQQQHAQYPYFPHQQHPYHPTMNNNFHTNYMYHYQQQQQQQQHQQQQPLHDLPYQHHSQQQKRDSTLSTLSKSRESLRELQELFGVPVSAKTNNSTNNACK